MNIPSVIENYIREGKAVLFLGSGASFGSKTKSGNKCPSTKELGNLLSDKFLGGKFKDKQLSQISELAISQSDLRTVQEFIRTIFEDMEPTQAHGLLGKFYWRAIATTNYDLLIEKAYLQTTDALQNPIPFIENGDRVDDKLRDPKNLMLLKLHGCITHTSNPKCPLILTIDQYIEYKKGRSRIFAHLHDLGYEKPIIFIGHSLQDSDLRNMLIELTTELGETRPRYYAVLPNFEDEEASLWEGKRVTLIKGTFEEFLKELDGRIASATRVLAGLKTENTFPIFERFKSTDVTLSNSCQVFLKQDAEYVKGLKTETIEPIKFYKGIIPSWAPIEQNLDVRRFLADTILSDHFLIKETEHIRRPEVVLIKAHAGAGKSMLLRRIAWDAAHDYDCNCLYIKQFGTINTSAIQELLGLCKERIFLFVEDAANRIKELEHLVNRVGPEGKNLTIIAAARTNEWNISSNASISSYVIAEHELNYLSIPEINSLLALLEKYRALGTLTNASQSEKLAAFHDQAGRQLLVALHEATFGKTFEDIIEDEYKNILPDEAKKIYLTICVLNRLNVPVRAGIISRLHSVPFEDFKKRFFGPLENVVETSYNSIIKDFMYNARHSSIAEIVFERVLGDQEERYGAYISCLRELNVDYSTDRHAFLHMVNYKNLLKTFTNPELIKKIYEISLKTVGRGPQLLHQMGLYEMNRPNGSLADSESLLLEALKMAPEDLNVKHSIMVN